MAEDRLAVVVDANALLKLTHADWFAILRLGEGRLSPGLIELLDKVIVGGVMDRPWGELSVEVRALNEALDALVNPTEEATGKNSEGG